VPSKLERYYDLKHLHFICCTCYHRLPRLGTNSARDLFVSILEHARQRYRFVVVGYVVMPEHFHLLISEPEVGDPSVVMKVLKERFARQLHGRELAHAERVWQKRFYHFNVRSDQKRIDKLRYIHRNPLKRGLVSQPDQWKWSSFRAYAYGEPGPVRVNFQEWKCEVKSVARQGFGGSEALDSPLIRKIRE
jgi:putative transposase